MKQTIENRIRFNILLIYLLAALICGGMIYFLIIFREDIDQQKRNVEQYYTDLSRIEELTRLVNQAQSEANLYISTKRSVHLATFRESLDMIEQQVGSIRVNETDSLPGLLFEEFSLLLKQKERIISQLNRQFTTPKAAPPAPPALTASEPRQRIDSVRVISTVIRDTVIKSESKRNFLQKVSDIFSRGQKRDTVITIKAPIVETITLAAPDSTDTASAMRAVAEQVKADYEYRITSIEDQVIRLVVADQEISSAMSTLLLRLYSNLIHSRLDEVQESEAWLRKNNRISIASGIIALLLILLFVILAIRNVNKSLRARQSLEEAHALTRQLMDSRHKLLLSISHDIKTPLSSILGYLELTRTAHDLSSKEIASMQRSGKHILALLENLFEFSSLEQGSLYMTQTAFNLYQLCDETTEMFAPLARQKNLSFETDFSFPATLSVLSDPLKVKQIIINILSNAVKYTSAGRIHFAVSHHDDSLRVIVSDSGAGIPAEQISHLFKPFTRIDKNNTLAEGTGFGLYVVKGLVDLLQGRIDIHSAEGQGTTVELLIPAPTAPSEATFASRRILAIDDDPAFLIILRDLLTRLGHTLVGCSSPVELEQLVKTTPQPFDFILTDLEMGNLSGVDILRRVRAADALLPVIVMTGRGDYNRQQALDLGFDDYLPKPVSLASLGRLFGRQPKTEIVDTLEKSGTEIANDFEKPRVEAVSPFESLNELFRHDREAIREVLNEFARVTAENIVLLEQALSQNDFARAQAVCHKMLPMFMQVGAQESVPVLQQMDSLRGESADRFPQWREAVITLIEQARRLIEKCLIPD